MRSQPWEALVDTLHHSHQTPLSLELHLSQNTPKARSDLELLVAAFQAVFLEQADHQSTTDIIDKLIHFFQRLPPCLVDDQRVLDEATRTLTRYPRFLEVAARIERNLPTLEQHQHAASVKLKADEISPKSEASADSFEQTTSSDFDEDYRPIINRRTKPQPPKPTSRYNVQIRMSKGEQRQKRTANQHPSNGTFLTPQDIAIWRDYTQTPTLPLWIEELQQKVDSAGWKFFEKAKSLLEHLQTPSVREYVEGKLQNTSKASPVPTSSPKHAVVSAPTLSNTLPKSFPSIQPLKAARLFDCDTEVLGDWRVLFTSRSISHLRQLNDRSKLDMIINKIIDLSKGFFSADNQKQLSQGDIPIYEAKLSRDLRIVYQIDIQPIQGSDHQIIKIWGIEAHNTIDKRLWSAISGQGRSREYRRRCSQRSEIRKLFGHNIKNVFMPLQWDNALQEKDTVLSFDSATSKDVLTEADFLELHRMLVLEKLVPYSRALHKCILSGESSDTLAHVFSLSPTEQSIIEHESATFVIGRSGSGKTTTLLFRIIAIEIAHRESGSAMPPPRQLFVTKSAVLATRVQDYYYKLLRAFDIHALSKEDFRKLRQSTKETKESEVFDDLVDEEDLRSDLPRKWSELEDKHFPLFISFDHLCALLEADLALSASYTNTSQTNRSIKSNKTSSTADTAPFDVLDLLNNAHSPSAASGQAQLSSNQLWQSFVDYRAFKQIYWPHFDTRLTKGLDSAMCFAEFVGTIGGSIDSLQTGRGGLSRELYLAQSNRVQDVVLKNRDRIYDLYEVYRHLKAINQHWDSADRTHALIQEICALNPESMPSKVDSLFVDEAQDNLLVDVDLMRKICPNPHNQFFAGDTAQTLIATNFRFNDLKAAWYNAEINDHLVTAGVRSPVQPGMFHLKINYRSHQGITELAGSLIDLLQIIFPYSIDDLGKETGVVKGPLPVMFGNFDETDTQFESFIFGGASSALDFGAEQCILVRDEKARDELRLKFGEDVGLVLTIYESKGLEFSDVLLYRFFSDSPASNEWRIVLSQAKDYSEAVPTFEGNKHTVILQELKMLYVAITRARNQCWIFDDSPKAEAMRKFWLSRELIKVHQAGDPLPIIAQSSSQSDWRKLANTLFQKQLFRQAANAFRRAGADLQSEISLAYLQRENARRMMQSNDPKGPAKLLYHKTANAFKTCAQNAQGTQAISLHKRSAECFVECLAFSDASQAYELAREHTEAASFARKAGDFDSAVRITKEPSYNVDVNTARRIIQTAKIYYLDRGDLLKIKPLFPHTDSLLKFVSDNTTEANSARMFESLGFNEKAAEAYEKDNAWVNAARAWDKAGKYRSAAQSYLACVRKNVRMGTQLILIKSEMLKHLNLALLALDKANLPSDDPLRRLCLDYQALLSLDRRKARQQWKLAIDPGLALLLLDYALQGRFDFGSRNEFLEILEATHDYAILLQPLILSNKLDERWYEVLGLAQVEGEALSSDLVVSASSPAAEIEWGEVVAKSKTVSRAAVAFKLSGFFARRLFAVLMQEHQDAMELKFLKAQCPHFLLHKKCKHEGECKYPHHSPYTRAIFANRVNALLAQLHVSQNCVWLGSRVSGYEYEIAQAREAPREWLYQLSYALHPLSDMLGSKRALNPRDFDPNHLTSFKSYIHGELLRLHDHRRFKPYQQLRMLICATALAITFLPTLPEFCFHLQICTAFHPQQMPAIKQRAVAQTIFNAHIGLRYQFGIISSWESLWFAQHLLQLEHRIDLPALFSTILEPLAASLILARRQIGDYRYNNILLPRQMLRDLARQNLLAEIPFFDEIFYEIQPLQAQLADFLVHLAKIILLNHNNLCFEGHACGTLVSAYFAYRAIRLVALLGSNIYDSQTPHISYQDYILQLLKSLASVLSAADKKTHSLYRSFLEAQQWRDIQRALTHDVEWETTDRLVTIKMRPDPLEESEIAYLKEQHIEAVQATTLQDLYKALLPADDLSLAFSLPTSQLGIAPTLPIPPSDYGLNTHSTTPTWTEERLDNVPADIENPILQDVARNFSEKQLEAAETIATWIKNKIAARKAVGRDRQTPYQARVATYFEVVGSISLHTDLTTFRYGILLRGPMVLLDLAVSASVQALNRLDRTLKEARQKADHKTLEDIIDKFEQLNVLRTSAREAAQITAPSADIHRLKSIVILREAIRHTGLDSTFFTSVVGFCKTHGSKMEFDKLDDIVKAKQWELGWKGVMQTRTFKPTPPLPQKPQLNAEDI